MASKNQQNKPSGVQNGEHSPRPVIVKTMVVDRNHQQVIDFFLDLRNWESGGAIKNAKKIDHEWWGADTPFGKATIRIHAENRDLGLFDHDFKGGGGEWTVYCRVTPNGRGSTVSWQFIRPEGMSQKEFETQLGTSFENEMMRYKEAIESH